MEEVGQVLGWVAIVTLVIVGLLAGFLASLVNGRRHMALYLVVGVVGALAAPVLAAALGVTAVVASGIGALLVAAAVGAVVVLVLVRVAFGRRPVQPRDR